MSERRDLVAARGLVKKAITTNSTPEKVVIDKNGANLAGLHAVNTILKFTGAGIEVTHMIRKIQFTNDNQSPFKVFAELAA
ncbi:hypothetical protein FHS77_003195 [Paenochrobactrum gallinarii]|uniref:Uncharacterized protein n=1 Tax=Paenochrobactrum gallinarii TaxID=643673 RepID=A0A841LWQ0_9HYPH|nr:hypothetical protein [Paenochrobactrum gallinarii]